jgi:tetratricopeptide (TPR) repeat protein
MEEGTVLKEYEQRLKEAGGGPNEAQYRYLYGRVLGQTGEEHLEDARKQFEQAAAINPKFAWAYDGLGTYYNLKAASKTTSDKDAADFRDKATQMFEKAVRTDGKLFTTKQKLAAQYMDVSERRASQAMGIRAKARGRPLTLEEDKQVNSLVRESLRLSEECKTRLLELLNEQPQEPEVYVLMAVFMYSDGSFLMAKQTALTGLALMKDKQPADPENRDKMESDFNGIAQKCDMLIRQLAENTQPKDTVFPHFFFEKEFRARLQSDNEALRANTVNHLKYYYDTVPKMKDEPVTDYTPMQMMALVLIGEALGDKSEVVQMNAVDALGMLQVAPFAEEVGKILVDKKASDEMRRKAALALGNMHTAKAVDPLIDGLEDKNQAVREYCLKGLRDMAVQTFGYGYADEPDKRAEAIKKIRDWWKENKSTYPVPEP